MTLLEITITNPYYIVIAVCLMVVLSYLFNLLASAVKVPSVLLLLVTGIFLRYAGNHLGITFPDTRLVLEILGIVGLILIVLEGSLDLKLSRDRYGLIIRSMLSALLILITTALIITGIFYYFLHFSSFHSLVYALPFAVISSAIAIPSAHKLSRDKKEFIVYESTFSDIIGIMIFNYITVDYFLGNRSAVNLFSGLLLTLFISAIASVAIILLMNYVRSHVKFYLVLSILILIYSAAKLFHLSSLILILLFGVMLNNAGLYIKGKITQILHLERINAVAGELKLVTAESSFLIRTFFFVLFGYTIDPGTMLDGSVLLPGTAILCAIFIIRFLSLKFISRSHTIPETFIAPRGLITIILYYSIPARLILPYFNEGIVFFVIMATSIIMTVGLVLTKSPMVEDNNI